MGQADLVLQMPLLSTFSKNPETRATGSISGLTLMNAKQTVSVAHSANRHCPSFALEVDFSAESSSAISASIERGAEEAASGGGEEVGESRASAAVLNMSYISRTAVKMHVSCVDLQVMSNATHRSSPCRERWLTIRQGPL